MLTKEEINEIDNFIKNSANPLFLFDNDPDGVCAYLILKKHYKKGSGYAIRTYPSLDKKTLPNIERYHPDLIVILDKAEVTEEFLEKSPCTCLWIDHHELKNPSKVHYYNPLKHNSRDNRPTTSLIYSITNSNQWLAMLGCISDYYLPDFADEFMKQFPDLIKTKPKDPGDVLYNSEFGKLVKIFSLNLKGKNLAVRESVKSMEKIQSPYEILNQTTEDGNFLFKRAEKLLKEYNSLLEKAKEEVKKDKLLIFIYPEKETSFTSDLAGEIAYLYPKKITIIGREKNDSITMSIRAKDTNILSILKKALTGIEGYGGGHEYACGASVKKEDFERFIENIKLQI